MRIAVVQSFKLAVALFDALAGNRSSLLRLSESSQLCITRYIVKSCLLTLDLCASAFSKKSSAESSKGAGEAACFGPSADFQLRGPSTVCCRSMCRSGCWPVSCGST